MKIGCFHFFIVKKEKYKEILIKKNEEEIKSGSCCGYCVLFSPAECFHEVFPCRPSDRKDKKGVYFAEIQEEN